MQEVNDGRRRGDHDPDKDIVADTMKLITAFGSIMDQDKLVKHCQIRAGGSQIHSGDQRTTV